jgi:small subunit ribosomal protein S1
VSQEESLLKLSEINPKMELTGIVKRIELAGAVIDIHAEADALLHISQIKAGRVKNVGDYLEEGKEVTVWVRHVDTERGQVSVTMIKPSEVSWNEVQVGQVFQGKVIRIEKFGIFVDIGAERPGLVHISELSSDYVASANDVVEKGAEVEVKVINVNRKKNQIDLSMKAMAVPVKIEETGDDEKMPTAMELAFQKAKEGRQKDQIATEIKQKAAQRAERQEEVLRRTLQRLENQ